MIEKQEIEGTRLVSGRRRQGMKGMREAAGGQNIITNHSNFQALAEKGARRRESEMELNDVRVDEN